MKPLPLDLLQSLDEEIDFLGPYPLSNNDFYLLKFIFSCEASCRGKPTGLRVRIGIGSKVRDSELKEPTFVPNHLMFMYLIFPCLALMP